MTEIQPALLNVNEVATLLDCSSRSIYRMTDRGLMPGPIKVCGNKWVRTTIDDWIRRAVVNAKGSLTMVVNEPFRVDRKGVELSTSALRTHGARYHLRTRWHDFRSIGQSQ
jgi:predicted DNA-binding transcriptional regulator AlpA